MTSSHIVYGLYLLQTVYYLQKWSLNAHLVVEHASLFLGVVLRDTAANEDIHVDPVHRARHVETGRVLGRVLSWMMMVEHSLDIL